jgi:tetratricopeptide (TPR) repeat protein
VTVDNWVSAAARYRSWLGWPALGLLLLILGLALPWFAIPLQPGRSAWSLPVVLAGMPAVSRISYGASLAACLCLGLLAAARSRGRAGAATAAVGAVALVSSLSFLVASSTADWPLQQLLANQTAEQAAIFSQFGYAVPGQQPSLMLAVPVTGNWALVAGALRLGWFCAAVGGLTLFSSGARDLAGLVRRFRWRGTLVSALAMLIVVGVLARGAVADYVAGQGTAAVRSGAYQAASASLADARQLNSLLASSTAYELALGQVLSGSGSVQPLAMLADADARGAMGDTKGQVAELRQAERLDPANPVLREQLDQASQVLGLDDDTNGPLQRLSHPTVADMYTEGRVWYATSDYPAALACFQRVLTMTGDGNVLSSAYTYIALSQLKLGQGSQARVNLLRAVSVDTSYNNTLARSLLTGLYISTKSGDA